MRYIDADKLLAEIDRRKEQDLTFRERNILVDIEMIIASLRAEMIITSLQQEQLELKLERKSTLDMDLPLLFLLDVSPMRPYLSEGQLVIYEAAKERNHHIFTREDIDLFTAYLTELSQHGAVAEIRGVDWKWSDKAKADYYAIFVDRDPFITFIPITGRYEK